MILRHFQPKRVGYGWPQSELIRLKEEYARGASIAEMMWLHQRDADTLRMRIVAQGWDPDRDDIDTPYPFTNDHGMVEYLYPDGTIHSSRQHKRTKLDVLRTGRPRAKVVVSADVHMGSIGQQFEAGYNEVLSTIKTAATQSSLSHLIVNRGDSHMSWEQRLAPVVSSATGCHDSVDEEALISDIMLTLTNERLFYDTVRPILVAMSHEFHEQGRLRSAIVFLPVVKWWMRYNPKNYCGLGYRVASECPTWDAQGLTTAITAERMLELAECIHSQYLEEVRTEATMSGVVFVDLDALCAGVELRAPDGFNVLPSLRDRPKVVEVSAESEAFRQTHLGIDPTMDEQVDSLTAGVVECVGELEELEAGLRKDLGRKTRRRSMSEVMLNKESVMATAMKNKAANQAAVAAAIEEAKEKITKYAAALAEALALGDIRKCKVMPPVIDVVANHAAKFDKLITLVVHVNGTEVPPSADMLWLLIDPNELNVPTQRKVTFDLVDARG
jgi:hypothetical protein